MRRVRFDQQSQGFAHWVCRQFQGNDHFSASISAYSHRDLHIGFVDSFKEMSIFYIFTASSMEYHMTTFFFVGG